MRQEFDSRLRQSCQVNTVHDVHGAVTCLSRVLRAILSMMCMESVTNSCQVSRAIFSMICMEPVNSNVKIANSKRGNGARDASLLISHFLFNKC